MGLGARQRARPGPTHTAVLVHLSMFPSDPHHRSITWGSRSFRLEKPLAAVAQAAGPTDAPPSPTKGHSCARRCAARSPHAHSPLLPREAGAENPPSPPMRAGSRPPPRAPPAHRQPAENTTDALPLAIAQRPAEPAPWGFHFIRQMGSEGSGGKFARPGEVQLRPLRRRLREVGATSAGPDPKEPRGPPHHSLQPHAGWSRSLGISEVAQAKTACSGPNRWVSIMVKMCSLVGVFGLLLVLEY